MKYDLDDEAILTEVKKYELDRGPKLGRLFIDVHKVIAGADKGHYIAIPNLLLGRTKQEFIAKGKTEEEALSECLKLIKSVSINEIIEI